MAADADSQKLRAAQNEIAALIPLLISGIQQSRLLPSARRTGTSPTPPTDSDLLATPQHNPLAVLHTAATLLSSQSTHLGLLSITPPFTPSAIAKTLNTIKKLLPALIAALQDAEHPRIPECVLIVSRSHVRTLFESIRAFVASVPLDAVAQRRLQAEAGEVRDAQQVLRGTGAVWEGCAWFLQAGENGARWIATRSLNDAEALVQDAAQELEGWAEASEDEDKDLSPSSEADEDDEDFFGGSKSCPAAILPWARKVIAHIGLLKELYPELRKIIDRFPLLNRQTRPEQLPETAQTTQLNDAIGLGTQVTRRVDDLAGDLYNEQEAAIVRALERFNDDLGIRAEKVIGNGEWLRRWRDLRP